MWKLFKSISAMFGNFQTLVGTQSPIPILQCSMETWSVELCSHVANQVYVVIEVAYEVIRNVMCCSASVPDKLPL